VEVVVDVDVDVVVDAVVDATWTSHVDVDGVDGPT
jgi:hypothetical protein